MPKQNSMDVIRVKCKANPSESISLAAFLDESVPFSLTPEELQVREALRFLYDTNAKDPPLFGKFPDWRKGQPLTIDCTTIPQGVKTAAEFKNKDNTIIFKKNLQSVFLMGCLAHELKHAEQWGKKVYDIRMEKIQVDNLAIQQVGLLGEAQAYLFENYVKMLFFQQDKTLSDAELITKMEENSDFVSPTVLKRMVEWDKKENAYPNYKKLEQELIPAVLEVLYKSDYQKDYEQEKPAHVTDKGLTELPREFGLDEEYAHRLLQGKLQEMPKDKLTADDYLAAQDQDRPDILRQILSQEYKFDGDGFLEDVDYSILVRCSYQFGDTDGMIGLLKKRNKKGKSWVLNSDKAEALFWLVTYHPIDEAVRMVQKIQQEPSAFNEDELSVILKDKRFSVPRIQEALKYNPKPEKVNRSEGVTTRLSKGETEGHSTCKDKEGLSNY